MKIKESSLYPQAEALGLYGTLSKSDEKAAEYQKEILDYDDEMLHGSTGLELFKILKNDLGYLGVLDHGEGAIYGFEPEQGVFFNSTLLNIVDVFDRRTHKDYIALVKEDN